MALKDKDKIGFLSDEGSVNYEGNKVGRGKRK